jgi:hypothetical protein
MKQLSDTTKFVIKSAFVTNRNFYHFYVENDDLAVFNILDRVQRMMSENEECFAVPYIMLQERVVPVKEVKLVFLGGKFEYISSFDIATVQKSLPGFSDDDLISFATAAVQTVSAYDEYITDGLVRVDIFKNNEGKLVVNELESLEARHPTVNLSEEGRCKSFLEIYWQKKIYYCISNLE